MTGTSHTLILRVLLRGDNSSMGAFDLVRVAIAFISKDNHLPPSRVEGMVGKIGSNEGVSGHTAIMATSGKRATEMNHDAVPWYLIE